MLYYHNKIFIITAEVNELSFAAYGIGMLRFELINENITWCNLCSHGQFMLSWSHITTKELKNKVVLN